MGSLSGLFISQSYKSLIHLETDTTGFSGPTQSAFIQLQDGLGNGTQVYLNTTGSIYASGSIQAFVAVSSSLIEGTNLIIKNKIELTGSIDIDGPVTASSAFIEGNLSVSGTIFAREIHTLIESSSVVFSSGSNILGDSILDTQTLIGSVIMSGSAVLSGSMGITGEISSSTVNGIGNVTTYSASVDYRLDNLETYSGSAESKFTAIGISTSSLNNYTQSAESKFAAISACTSSLNQFTASNANTNQFTASQETKNATLALYTASVDDKFVAVGISTSSLNAFTQSANTRLTNLEAWSTSLQIDFATQAELTTTASLLQNNINTKLDTSSFNSFAAGIFSINSGYNAFTASTNISLSNINAFTASNGNTSLNTYTASNDTKWNTLSIQTGSFATTGSNTFIGNQIISGSLRSNVNVLTIGGGTTNMDCSLGNFFTLNLPSSSTTTITATNIQPGQTISLKVKQLAISAATTGSLTYPTYIKFPQYGNYNPSPFSGAVDILSFVAFDTTTLYAVNVRNMNY